MGTPWRRGAVDMEARMVKWIGIAGWIAVGAGVFFGFFYLGADPAKSLAIVTVMTAGVEGITASCTRTRRSSPTW